MLIKKIKNKSRHRHDAKGTSDTGSEKLRMRRTRSIAAVVLILGGIPGSFSALSAPVIQPAKL
jgi:hypothetical protein